MKKYVLPFLLAILFIGHGTAQTDLQTWVNQRQYEKVLAQSMLMDMDTLDYANLSAIGQAYEGLLRYKEAYRIYERCLSMDSSRVDAFNSLARTAISLGKMRVAEDCFQKTLAMDSMNFYANYQLARVYALQGNYERAIGQYNVLNQMDTTFVNPIVYNNMADCYQRLNDLPSATLCYLRAYQANKENAGIANSLVTCMLRLGRENIGDALAICDTALYYNPENRVLQRSKAIALYMNRDYSRSDSLYSHLLAQGDSSFLTIKYGGASKYYAGRQLDAIPLLELAYVQDTTDVEVILLLGASLGMTYDRKRAYQLFDQAEALMQPDKALTNLLLVSRGETYWRDGRSDEAMRLFYTAWQQQKERLDYLYRIDRQLDNWGKSYKTEEELSKALFIKQLYLKECMATGRLLKGFHVYRTFLQYVYEDAFFQGKEDITMISPDGKYSTITIGEIKKLMNLLPESPDIERHIAPDNDTILDKDSLAER